MARMNYITLILGARGTGKSYYTINEIILKHPKKVLIVDTLDHPSYRAQGFQIVDIDSLSRWKSGVKRIMVNPVSIKEDLRKLCGSISNCLLIFEDATKYFRTNAPVELFNLIYDSKQKNMDILFMYHGFKKIVPELLDNANFITMFKMEEKIEKYEDKIPRYEAIEAAYLKIEKSKNPYEKKTVIIN
ncbi:hypothetical protein [Flavobacterium filum]|uniref:hypothetical protein n=1 Tax=Flavobacterium filum TaxID=370974 RepID=UPI0023F02A89|nr:hypothetical protein [Flavobacterium filum]